MGAAAEEREKAVGGEGADSGYAVVAHALLNSVGVIQGFGLELLEHGQAMSDAERRNAVSAIVRRAAALARIIEDLARGLPPQLIDSLDRSPAV